jgi:hypothetical protein
MNEYKLGEKVIVPLQFSFSGGGGIARAVLPVAGRITSMQLRGGEYGAYDVTVEVDSLRTAQVREEVDIIESFIVTISAKEVRPA